MLVHLRIADYAIIEGIELSFSPGFNAITGETGAGKSIIVGAAGLLRGGRVNADVVRDGAKEAVIEALYDISGQPRVREALQEIGLPADDDELLIRRVVPRSGRGRIHVNGALCTVSGLARLADGLFDISGQHEHQSLADRGVQRGIVDALGGAAADLRAMAEAHARLTEASEALRRTHMDDRQRAERLDFLRYQCDELQAARLAPGEDGELELAQRRLARAADLATAAEQAEQRLYGEAGSTTDVLATTSRRLQELQPDDPDLEPFARQLEEARVLVEDAAQGLGRYAQGVDIDPQRLQEVEERIDLLHRLKRKHGVTVDELIERLAQMQAEAEQLESLETRRAQLESDVAAARESVRRLATKLSSARVRSARQLSSKLSKGVAALRMPGAKVAIQVDPLPARDDDDPAVVFEVGAQRRRVGAFGWDRIDFVAALNPGEQPRPIGRVASGGELSRLMLALQQVLGEHDPVATSVFDEVDAGIGGAVADVVGRCLADVARHRQVVVVTHLPQVAAHADKHFHVGKARSAARRNVTSVHELSESQRVEELATMLGASEVTTQARANAKQLLRGARVRGSNRATC